MQSIPFAPFVNIVNDTYHMPSPLVRNVTYPDQTLNGRIEYAVTVQSQTFRNTIPNGNPIVRRIVHVDLANTELGPGTPMLDKSDVKGLYLELVEYKMWLQSSGDPADPSKPLDGWSIVHESPDSANQTGSITSSINWGFNATAGTFGIIPTAGAGANLGISNSHTYTLTNYTFYNNSTAKLLDMSLRMTMTQDGVPYKKPSDLLGPNQNPFRGIQLYDLPTLAKSNCPLPGQAFWTNDNDTALVPKLAVHISVTPQWCVMEGMQALIPAWGYRHVGSTYHYETEIDFSLLQ
jgi:hypothetical protein